MRTWPAAPPCKLTLTRHDGGSWRGDHILMLEWICRPGRLDKMLYIPLPAPEERAEILTALVRSKPLADGLDVGAIARDHCHGFSGADLSALVREAATNALKVSLYLPPQYLAVKAHNSRCNGVPGLFSSGVLTVEGFAVGWERRQTERRLSAIALIRHGCRHQCGQLLPMFKLPPPPPLPPELRPTTFSRLWNRSNPASAPRCRCYLHPLLPVPLSSSQRLMLYELPHRFCNCKG